MKFLNYLRTYFEDPSAPGVISSRRVNAFVCLVIAVSIAFIKTDVQMAALFLGASGFDTLTTLKRSTK